MIKVVSGILIDNDNVLIAKRPKDASMPNVWEYPGGKVYENELNEDALVREFKEELDMDIVVNNKVFEVISKYDNKPFIIYFYLIGTQKNSYTLKFHSDLKWVNKYEIYKYKLAETDYKVTKVLIQKGNL